MDGNINTRFSIHEESPSWIYVDLGRVHEVTQVVLLWGLNAYGVVYDIQVSDDAMNWVSLYSETSGDGGVDSFNVSGTGRYLRLYGHEMYRGSRYSLYEFEVWGWDIP